MWLVLGLGGRVRVRFEFLVIIGFFFVLNSFPYSGLNVFFLYLGLFYHVTVYFCPPIREYRFAFRVSMPLVR